MADPSDDGVFNPGGDAVHEPTSCYPTQFPVVFAAPSQMMANPVCCMVTGKPRDSRWAKESKAYLAKNLTCICCGWPSEVVHHIKPFHAFPELEMDPSNWAAVCHECHWRRCHQGNWSAWTEPHWFRDLCQRVLDAVRPFSDYKVTHVR